MRGGGEGGRHHRGQAVEAGAGGQQVVAVAMVAAAFGREHRGLRGAALRAAGAGAEQQGEGKGGGGARRNSDHAATVRSEEHTSELQSLMRISYAVFCLKKKTNIKSVRLRINHSNSISPIRTISEH